MTNYQQRKAWRVKLNAKRNEDKDHSAPRYTRDANVLNRAMRRYKIEGRIAQW
jgi:hypothetical protein